MAAKARLQGDALVEKLVEAFLAEAMDQGIHRVTLQMAARRAGVAYSSAHYHFGRDGTDIIDAALEHVASGAQKFVEASMQPAVIDPSANVVTAYLAANFDWTIARPSHASFWLYFYYLGTFLERYRQRHWQHIVSARARVLMLLQIEIGRGTIPKLTGLETAAAKVHAALVGTILMTGLEGPTARERGLAMARSILDDCIASHAFPGKAKRGKTVK